MTRASLLEAWARTEAQASSREIELHSHESAAGWLLATYESTGTALAMCPPDPWWSPVRELLGDLLFQEAADLREAESAARVAEAHRRVAASDPRAPLFVLLQSR